MMLKMKSECEKCGTATPLTGTAYICSFNLIFVRCVQRQWMVFVQIVRANCYADRNAWRNPLTLLSIWWRKKFKVFFLHWGRLNYAGLCLNSLILKYRKTPSHRRCNGAGHWPFELLLLRFTFTFKFFNNFKLGWAEVFILRVLWFKRWIEQRQTLA